MKNLYAPIITLILAVILFSCQKNNNNSDLDMQELASGFKVPADSVKPWCYYYWIGDDISKEGLTKDLEAIPMGRQTDSTRGS